MTIIYFTNYQKGQHIEFLKRHFRITLVTNCLECKFQSLHSNRTKIICVVTLKVSKWGKYIIAKGYLNNFTKIMFSFRDMVNILQSCKLLFVLNFATYAKSL